MCIYVSYCYLINFFLKSASLLIHQVAMLSVVLAATSLFSLKKLTNNVNEGGRGSSRGILSGQLECCPSYLLTSFHLGIQYIHREQLMFYYLLFHIDIYLMYYTTVVYRSCAGLNIKLWSARYTRIALRCSNLLLLQITPQFNFKISLILNSEEDGVWEVQVGKN